MIPVRVHVRDFLCYEHGADGGAVTFDFEGSRLWSISGDNGAGKSAIFDAIRYALYGEHRDGSQRDARLIRRGAASCEVMFEFRSDGKLYRVRRTVGRARGKSPIEPKTWQAALYDEAELAWLPIPGTDRKEGLDSWIQERLGLSYGTFIASVLLLQGESDKLTRAGSKDRFEILSGLLALEAYERLATTARDRARLHRSQTDQLDAKLAEQPAVRPEDLEAAIQTAVQVDQELATAQSGVSQTATLVAGARTYEQLTGELAKLGASLATIDALLTNEPKIREEHAEWFSLSERIPRMRQALAAVRDATVKEREAAETSGQVAGIDLVSLRTAADDAAHAEEMASTALDEAGIAFDDHSAALEALHAKLAVLEQHEAATKRVADLTKELSTLRAQLTGLPGLQEACAEGRTLREALPLIRLIRERQLAAAARQRELERIGTVASWHLKVKAAEKTVARAKASWELSEHEGTKSSRALARAEQQHENARSELNAREEAKDEAVCSRCGQKVSPNHIKLELSHVRAKLAETTAALRGATTAADAASKAAAIAADALNDAKEELAAAKRKLAEAQACAKEHTVSEATLSAARDDAAKASAAVRRVVRDATLEPPTVTVAAVERKVLALPELERQIEALREVQGNGRGVDTQLAQMRTTLEGLEQQLPSSERQLVRAEAARLGRERDAARSRRTRAQEAVRAGQKEAKRARDTLQTAQVRRSELESAARECAQGATLLREQAQLRLEGIDPAVRDAVLRGNEVVVTLAEARLAALAHAQAAYQKLTEASERRLALASKVEAKSQQVTNTPPEHRISVVAAREKQSEVDAGLATAQRRRDDAREELRGLRACADLRRELETQRASSRRHGDLYGRLADLLGRTGLQAVLMDEAIAGIGELANETLNRISGGQLRLVMERETTGRGEEIKIHSIDYGSSDDPLDVSFLSGSQKFRVAVALAAGIGQYSAGAGRIRALIIDEGFGSLDDQGRQQMVDELRTLSEVLDRVIVVSHQEDFQDRTLFPTGYVLRKAHQKTEVVRFV